MSEETPASEEQQLSFKVKTSSDGNHNITIVETATVLDLKNKLAGSDYENVPADRQRLIYSGRVMKNEEPLSTYKIKTGNTIHMVKSAQSNAAQNPASTGASAAAGSTPSAASGVPTNMAAGTANNPLAGLTGARYAGHMGLPGMDMFGADGGVSTAYLSYCSLLLTRIIDGCPAKRRPAGRHALQPRYCTNDERSSVKPSNDRYDDSVKPATSSYGAASPRDVTITYVPPNDD
jgi:hypothetical protein